MYSGTYSEQVKITSYKGALTIYGYTTDTSSYANNAVTIKHSESASAAGSDEASSTFDVKVDGFKMYNINVDNSYGEGSQAIALTSNGNEQGFYGCAFYGYQGGLLLKPVTVSINTDKVCYQDTLYAHSGYQYYKKCLIQGRSPESSQVESEHLN